MKRFLGNLQFKYKILIGMISITTLALLLISQFSYHYFIKQNTNEAFIKAHNSIRIASTTIDNQFNSTLLNTAKLLLANPFPDIIDEISHDKMPNYSKHFSQSSQAIQTFIQNNDLISSAVLFGSNGTFYSDSNIGLHKDPQTLFKKNIWDLHDITILPKRSNIITNIGYTTPIIFPLSQSGDIISFEDNQHENLIRFILLLDSERINTYFTRFSNLYTYSMYLADAQGNPLDILEESYPLAFLPEMKSLVSNTSSYEENQLAIHQDTLYVHTDTLSFANLKVVHIVKKSSFSSEAQTLKVFFLLTWLICTLLAAILCGILSDFLMRPLLSLTSIINQINNQAYDPKETFKYADEVGILGNQLNKMYDTIQLQIQLIKQEEQKKARVEIRLLSEQMNPHFLYNTLECIHFQVLNNHNSKAGSMLESLGRYLRITLSAGSEMIPISMEIEHVTTYMDIMNRHANNRIIFTCDIEPSLTKHMIIKMLLQPLVENSIKHGFNENVMADSFISPQIFIEIKKEDAFIKIEVSDNGKGIDIAKAKASLSVSNPNEKWHFALRNVYERLISYYGDTATIDFASIPYFKSSVIIYIPYIEDMES